MRTDEMNSADASGNADASEGTNTDKTSKAPNGTGDVLLATFSRPPQAMGQDVNASIVIAAESQSSYPGLKDAAQYFGPVSEIAKAQGFEIDEEPYKFSVGTKGLVRGDFERNVGSRVMHQSTLVMLSHGYAVSFTFIAGTDYEVEDLIGKISFATNVKATK